ncbi:Uncharacterised protein [Achromobacter denitrificans]|nr:hypothetical protein LMG1231_00551 [Achromobacter denitrificans]SUW33873.1 Uncharacterised protein [Achromobacter denitrificans]
MAHGTDRRMGEARQFLGKNLDAERAQPMRYVT